MHAMKCKRLYVSLSLDVNLHVLMQLLIEKGLASGYFTQKHGIIAQVQMTHFNCVSNKNDMRLLL